MNLLMKSIVGLSALAMPISASAAPYLFYGGNGFSPSSAYMFQIDSNPTPDSFTNQSFTIDDIALYRYDSLGGDYQFEGNRSVTFFLGGDDPLYSGGLDVVERQPGDQLFSGSLANPVFKEGFYTIYFDFEGESFRRTARIEAAPVPPTSGVPESSTWAMMLIGFGAVGGALRRRQAKVFTKISFAK